MKNIIIASSFIFLMLLSTNLQAQQIRPSFQDEFAVTRPSLSGTFYHPNIVVADTSDSLSGWKLSWIGGLHGSQASYSNWSSGGVNAVSATASTLFDALYQKTDGGII